MRATTPICKFVSGTHGRKRFALTIDRTGRTLPADGAPWRAIGRMPIAAEDYPRTGASIEQVVSEVERNGYFVWPRRAGEASNAIR